MKGLIAFLALLVGVGMFGIVLATMPITDAGVAAANASANISEYDYLGEVVRMFPWILSVMFLGLVFFGWWRSRK